MELLTLRSSRQLLLRPMIDQLAAAARAERTLLSGSSREWQFYLGVEAAANGVLHPERYAALDDDWLSRETESFREGFLAAQASLSVAISAPTPPTHLALPRP